MNFTFAKDISARDNELIINFVLPWTNHIYIEYTLSCQWPVVASPSISTHYVNNIKGKSVIPISMLLFEG